MKISKYTRLFLDKETGGSFGSDAGSMTQPEFQRAAAKSLGSIEDQNATLVKNYEQLDTSTKKAFEELTALKNNRADDLKGIEASFARIKLALAHERRQAFGDPVARIARDSEKRNLFVAMLAKTLGNEVLEACGPRIREMSKHLRVIDGMARRDIDTTGTPGSVYIDTNEVERDVYDLLATYGAYRTVDFRMVGTKTTEIPLKTARTAMSFVDEAVAITPDVAKAGSRTTLTPKKLAGLISASTELLEDDVIGVVQDILNDFAESTAEELDWITFSADGTADATDGGFTGMFHGGTAVAAATGNTTTGQLELNDFINTVANAPVAVLNRMARWWIHPTMLVKLLKIVDGNGRPIFNTAIESPSAGSIGSILGYPVTTVANAPSTDSASGKVACFGDPFAMALRMRRDLRIDRSEHFAFNTDEITFRATLRAGAKIKAATGIQVLTLAAA
jgi:HK97 family phage major capsid protein